MQNIVLLIAFPIMDAIAITMMVLTIRSCARNLNPNQQFNSEPDTIRRNIINVIPEGTLDIHSKRIT
jgi:hypothetical protein